MKKTNKIRDLFGNDYFQYLRFLSQGNTYSIIICKSLLIKPFYAFWIVYLLVGFINYGLVYYLVGLPAFLVFIVFLEHNYPYWNACGAKRLNYYAFNLTIAMLLQLSGMVIRLPYDALLKR